jgi:hypothetical protein
VLLPSNRTPGHFIKAHIIMAAGNDPLQSVKSADRATIEKATASTLDGGR